MDPDFQEPCDHEHTEGDVMVGRCDDMFDVLLKDAVALYKEMDKKTTVTMSNGTRRPAELHRIQDGYGHFTFSDDEAIEPREAKILYSSCSMNNSTIDKLVLWETLEKLRKNHLKLRKHLFYLDHNQTDGENEIDKNEQYVGKMDYMMKLRACIFKMPTSKFHMVMNKGTSVHVFALKKRLADTDITPEMAEKGYEAGDCLVTHIDSFCSNTGQGGYETLCAGEAALKRAMEVHPSMPGIGLCSDAGSGYRSTQVILGLRASKSWGCPRVKWVHFNAPGEGKRHETDGHNPELKARRRIAMMAGHPFKCTTPRAEVLAQLYDECPSIMPHLLEFDYDEEQKIGQWDGINSYHDFRYNEGDDSITVWKSYNIGPGKTFSKETLDKMYTCFSCESSNGDNNGAVFPQPSTKAKYVPVDVPGYDDAAVGPSNVKLEKSKKRKRKEQAVKDEKKEAKRQKKEEDAKLVVNLRQLRNPHCCAKCDRHFPTESALDNHECRSTRVAAPGQESRAEGRAVGSTLVPYSVGSNECEFVEVRMGHGLTETREKNAPDAVVEAILEDAFQAVQERKGVLEMFVRFHLYLHGTPWKSEAGFRLGWNARRKKQRSEPTTRRITTPIAHQSFQRITS
jgi:hypothetical protein